MKRPGIVTGLAFINFMGALSALWLFNAKAHIGIDPIYPGSALPVRWQWNWVTVAIASTFVTTVGLFRGWNWARWFALILCIVGYIFALPVRDVHMVPDFIFTLSGSVIAFAILFFAPTVKVYFTCPAEGQRTFSVRRALSISLLLFAAFTVHSIVKGVFWRTLPVDIAWIGLGVFLLPTLLLSVVARWQLEISLREISVLFLATAIFFVNEILSNFLALRFAYSNAAMPYLDWLHSVILASVFGVAGLLLTVCVARRYPVPST